MAALKELFKVVTKIASFSNYSSVVSLRVPSVEIVGASSSGPLYYGIGQANHGSV